MYPAMARTFRAVGAQFAAMFAYDMLRTASRNLGWQTHYLNLVYTPRKAMSAIIAAEAMRRLPRMRSYGPYPRNTRFGDFRVSPRRGSGASWSPRRLSVRRSTRSAPPDPGPRRIAGFGSSPVVTYDGVGVYFLDRSAWGLWRLEVYPDAVPVRDPFEPPSPGKIVTRAISRAWPMTSRCPISARASGAAGSRGTRDRAGRARPLHVTPGVYVLSAAGAVDLRSLPSDWASDSPSTMGRRRTRCRRRSCRSPADLPADARPSSVPGSWTARPGLGVLYLRPAAGRIFRGIPMRPSRRLPLCGDDSGRGPARGPARVRDHGLPGDSASPFPGGLRGAQRLELPRTGVLEAGCRRGRAHRSLFDPGTDAGGSPLPASATRDAAAVPRGIAGVTGRPVFHLALPVDSSGWSPADYTASLAVVDRIRAGRRRSPARSCGPPAAPRSGPRQMLHVTLMEDDGTSWTRRCPVDSVWTERTLRSRNSPRARRASFRRDFRANGTTGWGRRPAAGLRAIGRGSSIWSGCSSRFGPRTGGRAREVRGGSGVGDPRPEPQGRRSPCC